MCETGVGDISGALLNAEGIPGMKIGQSGEDKLAAHLQSRTRIFLFVLLFYTFH